MRAIDADAFRREIDNHWPFTKEEQSKHGIADMAKGTLLYVLNCMPTIEPERKRGEWIRTDMTDIVYGERISWAKWNCSKCGIEKKIGWAKGVNFCPNCGVDMRKKQDG